MKFRPDIEGLRALAVLLVVLSHLGISGFSGGYVGVDVFFVISGYLITGLISSEYARNAAANEGHGTFSLRAFYFRRVKRILPMSFLVLISTTVAAYLLFNTVRAGRIANDSVWAALFAANIHFINQATDYFQQGFATSPLQHYWSLAVEEQFYLVVPALFLFAVKRHGITVFNVKLWWERRVGVLISIITLASFGWSIYETNANPLNAYFSSLTRAWELGVGALLAIATLRARDRLTQPIKAGISIVGLGLIVYATLTFTANTKFPGFVALVPVLGAGLIIYSGLFSSTPISKVLSIKSFTFIGNISYSVYLWHWPLIVLINATHPNFLKANTGKLTLILGTIALSYASFKFIEQPFRKIRFPERWIGKKSNQEEKRFSIQLSRENLVFIGSLMVIAATLIGLKLHSVKVPTSSFANQSSSVINESGIVNFPATLNPNVSTTKYENDLAKWNSLVSASNSIQTLPINLFPSISNLSNDWLPAGNFRGQNPSNPQKLAYIFGDSTAQRIPYLMTNNLDPKIWKIGMRSFPGCDLMNVKKIGNQGINCSKLRRDFFAEVKINHPDLVLVTHQNGWFTNTLYSTSLNNPNIKAFESNLDFLAKNSRKVVFLGSIPTAPLPLTDCITRLNVLQNTCFGKTSNFDLIRNMEINVVKKAGGVFADSKSWFCSSGICPPIIDGTIVMLDKQHMTDAISQKFSKIFGEWLWSQSWATLLQGSKLIGSNSQTTTNIVSTPDKSLDSINASWQHSLTSSMEVKRVPKGLNPTLSEASSVNFWNHNGCRGSVLGISCVHGHGKTLVLLAGDSHARMFDQMVSQAFDPQQYTVVGRYQGYCKFADVTPWAENRPISACNEWLKATISWIKNYKPSLLILTSNDGVHISVAGHLVEGSAESQEFMMGFNRAISQISTYVKHIVILGQTPSSTIALSDCVNSNLEFDQKCFGAPAQPSTLAISTNAVMDKWHGYVIDPTPWLCVNKICPPIIGKTLVTYDGSHLTDEIAYQLSPIFKAALQQLKLIPQSSNANTPNFSKVIIPAASTYNSKLNQWRQLVLKPALKLQQLPSNLDPSFASLSDQRTYFQKCSNTFSISSLVAGCLLKNGNLDRTVVIYGDSESNADWPLVTEAFKGTNYRLVGLTRWGCPVAKVVPFNQGKVDSQCAKYREDVLSYLSKIKPVVTILAEKTTGDYFSNGAKVNASQQRILWTQGISESLSAITKSSIKTVYIGQLPSQSSLQACVRHNLFISISCLSIPSKYADIRSIQRSTATKFGAKYIDPTNWLCVNGICPAVVGNNPVYSDGLHLTQTFAQRLAPLLVSFLATN